MLRNHLRVNFGKIDQTGWNVDTDVDSWAISYIAYHPVLELMRVVFRSRKYVMYDLLKKGFLINDYLYS
jgi:hypothetical protein